MSSGGGGLHRPSLRRSTPVHATMTPLSVQYLAGGQMQGRPKCAAAAVRPCGAEMVVGVAVVVAVVVMVVGVRVCRGGRSGIRIRGAAPFQARLGV